MVFRDLFFVSNTSYGSKIDKMREYLNKNYLRSFFGFKKFSSQTGQSIYTPVADEKFLQNFVHFTGVLNLSL